LLSFKPTSLDLLGKSLFQLVLYVREMSRDHSDMLQVLASVSVTRRIKKSVLADDFLRGFRRSLSMPSDHSDAAHSVPANAGDALEEQGGEQSHSGDGSEHSEDVLLLSHSKNLPRFNNTA
jgi:hypothetical protein